MSQPLIDVRPLGDSGLRVGCVGLGTYRVFNVKGDAVEARCDAVVDSALAAGSNLFDTSPMYGSAERVLAMALEDRRDEAIVAAKIWARDRATAGQQIKQTFEYFETVDVFQVHNLLGLEEHLPNLRDLKSDGRVKAIGVSHYLESAESQLKQLVRDRLVDVIQVPYHARERWIERELLDEANRMGVGIIAMTPLAAGNLLTREPTPEELEPLHPFGVYTWAQALIKWVCSDERISCVIPATSNPDHATENAKAGGPPWFTGDERLYIRRLVDRLA